MTSLEPAEVFPPGEYIADELDARGWTQQDLAVILDRPLNAVNQIITGKRGITAETAKGLAAAFGTSPEFWMNLENGYQLGHAKSKDNDVALRAKLYGTAPVSEMIRRRWIEGTTSASRLESQLKRFFEAEDLGAIAPQPTAARNSSGYSQTTPAQLAWFYRARSLARTVAAARFDRDALTAGLRTMRNMTLVPQDIQKVPALLAGWGIRLLLVESLQRTRIDGSAFWLDPGKPAIALSLRLDRIDAFWLTLLHELLHIKNGDSPSIDSDLVRDPRGSDSAGRLPEAEEKTSAEASRLLLSPQRLGSFILRARPLYAKEAIADFAQTNGIHPGIVVGQLQQRGEIPYSHGREMLVPVRRFIVGSALTDGWGNVAIPPHESPQDSPPRRRHAARVITSWS
jgi:HTH-type transcriptional regulator/antitoxin HigA